MEMYNPPHPGEVFQELYLEPLGLSITDAAEALGVSERTLSGIINGYYRISSDLAMRLSKAFDTTPELWLGMQQDYDLWQAKQKIDLSEVRVLRKSSPEVKVSW